MRFPSPSHGRTIGIEIGALLAGAAIAVAVIAVTAGGTAPPGDGAVSTQQSVTTLPVVRHVLPGQPVCPVLMPSSVVARLTAIADKAAAADGAGPVEWATAVLTTRAKALTAATPGDSVASGGNAPAYLITMRGSFTDQAATGPPGAQAPTGHYLSLVVDGATFQALDSGLSDVPPPVPAATLGSVVRLPVNPQGVNGC